MIKVEFEVKINNKKKPKQPSIIRISRLTRFSLGFQWYDSVKIPRRQQDYVRKMILYDN